MTHFDALAPEYDRLRPAGDGWNELARRSLAALAGARRLVEAGGSVMAQDEASSAIWGMPRAVTEAGLACAVLPPDKLARRVAARAEEQPCK